MSRQSYSRSPSAPPPAASTLVPQSAARNLNALDSPLRPCYYLERPDGTRTALIEVDQLPDLFRIRGLSPKLSAADTAGMTSVGIKEGGQRKYTVEVADSSATPHLGEPSKHTESENAPVTITATPSSKAPSDSMIECNAEDSATAAQMSPPASDRPEQENVIAKRNPKKGEKVYCTYWISRGECHFEQQGCRFKHEMPDLDTLGEIMGRRSFPKWWLESIGSMLAPPQHLRPTATNNRQQGKRRAIAPKPFAFPSSTYTHTNSNSAPSVPSIVLQAPTEELSNGVKSSPTTSGSRFAARKDSTVDIRSQVSSISDNNLRPPVAGLNGSNIRTSVFRPGASSMHASVSGSSAGNTRSSSSGPSSSNVRSPISGTRSNGMTHNKQPVSDIPGGNNMIQTKQLVSNSLTNATPPVPQNTSLSEKSSLSALRVKIPEKYSPPFHVAVLPTVSSSPPSSSPTPMNKPRVNLPLSPRQDNVPSTLGNINDGKESILSGLGNADAKGKGEKNEAGMGGRLVGGFASTTTGGGGSEAKQTTGPYSDFFDLLGPF